MPKLLVFEVCFETYSICIVSVRSWSYCTATATDDWTKPLRLLVTPGPHPVWKRGSFPGVSEATPHTSAMPDPGAASAVVLSPAHPAPPPSPVSVCPHTKSCPEVAHLCVWQQSTRLLPRGATEDNSTQNRGCYKRVAEEQDKEIGDVSQTCSRLSVRFAFVRKKTCGTLNASSNFLKPVNIILICPN